MVTLPLVVAVGTSSGTEEVPKISMGWSVGVAGAVAYVTDRGTFCVYSPFTNGQLGECLSCSDLNQTWLIVKPTLDSV